MKENELNEILEEAEEIASDFDGGWWNYRIIEKTERWKGHFDKKFHTETYYEIHEVYYNGKGKIVAWTENAVTLDFFSWKDYKDTMKYLKKAAKRTILKLDNDELIDTHRLLRFRR